MKDRTTIPPIAALCAAAGLALSAATGGALAAPSEAVPTSASAEATGPLGGPEVDDNDAPGEDGRFVEGERMERRGGMSRGVPARMFGRAIRSLAQADDAELTLTDEQRDEIRSLMQAHREAMRAFREEHAEELQQLRSMLRPEGPRRGLEATGDRGPRGDGARDGDGMRARGEPDDAGVRNNEQRRRGARAAPDDGPRGADQPEPTPEQLESRAQLQELRAQAPSFDDVQAKVWRVLTVAQQAHVEAEIERIVAERRLKASPERTARGGEAGERERERRAEQPRGSVATQEQRAQRFAERLNQMPPERLERLLDRVNQLPPERRERVMAFIESVIDRTESSEAREEPPSMDNVNVPN
jgi:hypothetical protein